MCDGLIRFYTIDDVRQWQPVWMWTTLASAVVLILFAAMFHSKAAGKDVETPAEAAEELEEAIRTAPSIEPTGLAEEPGAAE